MVTLQWTAAVDLDLMAFYKTKDGRVGGIYSDNYAGGSLGRCPFRDRSVPACGADRTSVTMVAQNKNTF